MAHDASMSADPQTRHVATVSDASVLFLPDCGPEPQERFIGSEAVSRYLDSGMLGRFIQSLKSVLPDAAFRGTEIYGKRYSSEDLVAMILSHFKRRVEDELGEHGLEGEITRAVFGRPVRFSDEEHRDSLAEERLAAAAERSGFKEVRFVYEPVAAARLVSQRFGNHTSGGSAGSGTETALVCDYGGGTSDFSVIRIEDGVSAVLANHGTRVGGDDFDGEIMWHRLVQYFGYGTDYESYGKMLPVPVHIYRTLMRWDRIAFLKTAQYRDDLKYIHHGAADQVAIEWLIRLIDEDLGYALFSAIRDAKHALANDETSAIAFFERGIELKERLYRDEFETCIDRELDRIGEALDTVLDQGSRIDNPLTPGASARFMYD